MIFDIPVILTVTQQQTGARVSQGPILIMGMSGRTSKRLLGLTQKNWDTQCNTVQYSTVHYSIRHYSQTYIQRSISIKRRLGMSHCSLYCVNKLDQFKKQETLEDILERLASAGFLTGDTILIITTCHPYNYEFNGALYLHYISPGYYIKITLHCSTEYPPFREINIFIYFKDKQLSGN